MATAADHRIIIEKGADFKINVQVSENGITNKDLTGFTVEMVIKYEDPQGVITELDTIIGELVEDAPGSGTYLDGNISVTIDKAVTATYATRITPPVSPFATEYHYFYNIDINEGVVTADKENLRVLRGKCAVRV